MASFGHGSLAFAPLIALTILGATGCFDNVESPFPEGLEPLSAEHLAVAPDPTAEDAFPETIRFARVEDDLGLFVHARAFVHADVAAVFAGVREPAAGSGRKLGTDATFELDVEPAYRFSHVAHQIAYDIITVTWDTTWRSDVVEGTLEAPTLTSTRWQKTFGSATITTMEGAVVCRYVEDGVTEVDFQYRLNALATSWETVEDYLLGYYEAVLALAHGEPLPPQRP